MKPFYRRKLKPVPEWTAVGLGFVLGMAVSFFGLIFLLFGVYHVYISPTKLTRDDLVVVHASAYNTGYVTRGTARRGYHYNEIVLTQQYGQFRYVVEGRHYIDHASGIVTWSDSVELYVAREHWTGEPRMERDFWTNQPKPYWDFFGGAVIQKTGHIDTFLSPDYALTVERGELIDLGWPAWTFTIGMVLLFGCYFIGRHRDEAWTNS